jgi:CRP/FNR family cyclic AMP-dependent transcriptional regulator
VNGPRSVVLDEDSELADLVPHPQLQTARQASVAATVELEAGKWDARVDADRAREGYGLLALDGVLVRRVGYGGRFGAELLAAGDLLRPWEYDGDETIGFETTWRVLSGTRLAVLDIGWTERMARYARVGPA